MSTSTELTTEALSELFDRLTRGMLLTVDDVQELIDML
jgi:hypothetical protein